MPINPGVTQPIFDAVLAAHGDFGPMRSQLAGGLALGLYNYMQSAVTATSIDAGTLGVGKGLGFGIVLPLPALSSAMIGSFVGHDIGGVMSAPNAIAISNATCTALSTAVIAGFHPTVGLGAGKLQLAPRGAGFPIFSAAFKGVSMTGVSAEQLAGAVSTALDAVIASATGVIAIVGPPNIAPGGGVGIITIQ